MFAVGSSVTVPKPLTAFGPTCEYVKVVAVGPLVTGNVPLKEGSATPAMVTVWPKPKKVGSTVVTVTTLLERETDKMPGATVLSVSATAMFVTGNADVLVMVTV